MAPAGYWNDSELAERETAAYLAAPPRPRP